jgi:hypothetical protein
MPANTNPIKMDKLFSNVIQSLIVAGIIGVIVTLNKIDSRLAVLEERINSVEEIKPIVNQLQLNDEDFKGRLNSVELNQHHIPN